MSESLKLMCVFAHPDDESLGAGGILAKYAAEGVKTYLLTATRGEGGWFGDEADYPGAEALGRIREAELCAAAEVLGLEEVVFLGYHDGELDRADPAEAIGKIAAHLRRVRPQVVVTFGAEGAYGHPDHIAISQFTTAAIVAAAAAGDGEGLPHAVSKLYYLMATDEELAAYESLFDDLVMSIDGVERHSVGWPAWAITTRVDTADYWQQVWRAAQCHDSQLLPWRNALADLSEQQHRRLWGVQTFYRVFSLVNGGRQVEEDLFEGIR